jgi:hypothetical protein
MLSEILDAMCLEVQALFKDTGNTVLRDTQFKMTEMPLYTIPVIVMSLKESPEIRQLIGGMTKADFGWHIKAYFYDANSDLSMTDPFSTEAYDIIHTIYQHFAARQWLTDEFIQVSQTFGYKLTLNGMSKAEPLRSDAGVIPGFSITYDSVGLDIGTADRSQDGPEIEDITQSPDNSYLIIYDSQLNIDALGEAIDFTISANTPFVIQSDSDWLTIDPIDGNEDSIITLTASENDSGAQRQAILTIKVPMTDIEDQKITIIQST